MYNWGSDIDFSSDIYLEGNATDLLIFQSTGNVIAGSISNSTYINIKAGLIAVTTFTAGVYNWGSDVDFGSDITSRGTIPTSSLPVHR